MSHRFLQLHVLTSYPAALLNRDDAGFAKRIPFGGASRTRISSQCLKRHWRTFEGEGSLRSLEEGDGPVPMSIRSRRTFEQHVLQPLVEEGVAPELAEAATEGLIDAVFGKSAKRKATQGEEADGKESTAGRTGQVTVLGRPEVEFLLSEAREVCREATSPKEVKASLKERLDRDARKNLEALRLGSGLDAALFGRMVTGDILARGDAAIHVAHAFTVHAEAAETDYFSAVDDLLRTEEHDELGSGHIGSTELTSGLFYGYIVVDVPLLVSNLEGCPREAWHEADRSLAGGVLERLVPLVATVSPGAKLGSTAPYAHAHLVLAESGSAQPRTLANAFLKPVAERPDLVENTYGALGRYLADLDAMYGPAEGRKFAALGPVEALGEALPGEARTDLQGVASWAASRLREAS